MFYYSHDVSTFDTFVISGFLILQDVNYCVLPGEQFRSTKLCLYERGHFTEHEKCSVWFKISISNNSCQYSFVIASVGFNIDCITTQHTPKCVENSDSKVSYNCLSNFYQIFCNLDYYSENNDFFLKSRLIILL